MKHRAYAPVGYGADYRRQWEVEQAEREREAEELREQTAEIRRQREKKIEQERQAKLAEAEAEFDQMIEPQKVTLRHQWLADHPGQDSRDFERKAWPHLRANLKAELESAQADEIARQLRASGSYSGF